LSGNVALIIGSEAVGISDETIKNADLLIKIPMAGRAESLNASAAAAVMMFEAMRQRGMR
jgi:TrmH family RNA methyltransferase